MIEAAFFAVAVLAALYLLAPAFRPGEVPAPDPRAALEAARDAGLRSLKDLELDWATGKLSDEDYRTQRAALEAETAAIVRQLAALEPQTPESDA
ncbi:MAG: hypothetical protein QN187_01310 [Armatimonadota bacterium]|nr:hypothetical protein [Armatimonadota bacterium]MDR7550482.1 hypothetical protein [Armatimonadota bacterium]